MTDEGKKPGRACPDCGAPEGGDAAFCGVCGAALAGQMAPARLYARAMGAVTLPSTGASKRPGKSVRHFAGHSALAAGRFREAVEQFDLVLRSLRPPRVGPESTGAWIFMGVAHACLGEFAPAADAYAAAARQLEAHPQPRAARHLAWARGWAALLQAEWARAAELLTPVAQAAAPDGDAVSEGLAMVLLAWAQAMGGALHDAAGLAQLGLARLDTLGPVAGQSLWIAAHGEALRGSGQFDLASASAERALGLAAAGDRWGELLAERTTGQCLMAGMEVDAEEVARHLDRAVALGIERGARADLAMARLHLAELCFMEENWDACRTELDQTSWLSLGLEMPWLRDRAMTLRARMPRKDTQLRPPVPGETAN